MVIILCDILSVAITGRFEVVRVEIGTARSPIEAVELGDASRRLEVGSFFMTTGEKLK